MGDFKEKVIQNLDSSGNLDSLRALLRANVFDVLKTTTDIQVTKPTVSNFLKTKEGLACVELFIDFLTKSDLSYTAEVFRTESGLHQIPIQETPTYSSLLNIAPKQKPALYTLLNHLSNSHSSNSNLDSQSLTTHSQTLPSPSPPGSLSLPSLSIPGRSPPATASNPLTEAKRMQSLQERVQSLESGNSLESDEFYDAEMELG